MGIVAIYNRLKSVLYKQKNKPEENDDFLNFGKTLEDGIFVSKKESGYTLE